MSALPASQQSALSPRTEWARWIPVGIGLLALYVPTYLGLASGIWSTDEQGHGPIVLALVLWLFWQKRSALIAPDATPAVGTGIPCLTLGLLLYILGRSQEILVLDVGSQIVVLIGIILLTLGWSGLRRLWFPLVFMIFLIPLPGFLVDAVTGSLKQQVSAIAESLLYIAGYPIARSGVTLSIGPYQLLVADACSGMHTLYSLSALGVLYLYLMGHKNVVRNAILLISILPIAFMANIVRVLTLVLITYHFGDEAGSGFLHGFAGMILFIVALSLLFAFDGLLGLVFSRGPNAAAA